MKGKDSFTGLEVQAIKKLIAEKAIVPADKQKGIRNKIRKIGFYFSDFSSKKDGYTIADLDTLVRLGQIKITQNDFKSAKLIAPEKEVSQPIKKKYLEIKNSANLNANLKAFKQNCFDPKTQDEIIIPNSSGNYILCLKKNSKLPVVSIKPILERFEDLQVIYTGIASNSLRARDFRQHFKGNNAGMSTLRKSLGVLFGYKQIKRDKDPSSTKTKFAANDEQKLSDWMHSNLMMFFLPTSDFKNVEIDLINHFNPPLNLKDNNNQINCEYRKLLSNLRCRIV